MLLFYKGQEKIEASFKQDSGVTAIRLAYEWVKTGHWTFHEFETFLRDLNEYNEKRLHG